MHDDLFQKISQLLDDELSQEEASSLLQKIQARPELADKIRRYETISHAIKNGEAFVAARPDFVASVSSRIRHEPAYLIPDAAQRLVRRRGFTRSHKIAAAAASIAVIAFIAHMQRPNPSGNLQIATAKPPSDHTSASKMPNTKTFRDPYPVNQQINDYLQAHNSSIYTNGQADFQPYAQVTGYSQK